MPKSFLKSLSLFILILILAQPVLAGEKVYICHMENGTPDKTLHISVNAAKAHIDDNHGDFYGFCPDPTPIPPTPTSTPVPPTSTPVIPTNTPVPTNTPISPTNTPIPSPPSPGPENTPTPTSQPAPTESRPTKIPTGQSGEVSVASPPQSTPPGPPPTECSLCCPGEEAYYLAMAEESAARTKVWEVIAENLADWVEALIAKL